MTAEMGRTGRRWPIKIVIVTSSFKHTQESRKKLDDGEMIKLRLKHSMNKNKVSTKVNNPLKIPYLEIIGSEIHFCLINAKPIIR